MRKWSGDAGIPASADHLCAWAQMFHFRNIRDFPVTWVTCRLGLDPVAASRPRMRGEVLNQKLKVLVRVDLDCGEAQVAAQGHVTAQSIQALYVVMKRANHLRQGLQLVVDVSHARVEPVALEQLRECSKTHHLPRSIDPQQSECNVRVLAPADGGMGAGARRFPVAAAA